MRTRRKKSNLTLNSYNRKQRKFKPLIKPKAWPSSLQEVLGVLEYSKHLSPAPPQSVEKLQYSSSQKRIGSMSPYIYKSPYKYTPSKVPSSKKMRKCLFEKNVSPVKGQNKSENEEKSNDELLSEAITILKKEGMHTPFIDFLKLIREGKFPLDSIVLTLFTDVVRWYSCANTSEMRYSRESKLFWKLGYRLFGGRFLHFMGGTKSEGQLISNLSERGLLNPLSSKINFAVPSTSNLMKFDPYDLVSNIKNNSERPFAPGLLVEMIKTLGLKVKDISCCLTFDGKKIKQGLTPTSGDVDLFGFEKTSSLYERKEKLKKSIKPYLNLQHQISCVPGSDEVIGFSHVIKDEVKERLKDAMCCISKDIIEIRDLRKKKEYAKLKLIERCGEENWKNSKFAMAISSTIAFIYDIDKYLDCVRDVLNEILSCLTSLNCAEQFFIEGDKVNVNECKNYHGISETESTPALSHTREIKQRTDHWHKRRKLAKVTGSSLFTAIGLDGLKKQQTHFDIVVCGNDKEPVSEKVSGFMQYGTENEINAVSTLVGKIIPAFYPGKLCCEEGFIEMDLNNDGVPFMIVSPDGSIRSNTDMISTEMALEFKCPVMDIHKSLPERYVLQCQAEIEALGVDSLLYVCWRPDFSSVFLVKKDPHLFAKAFQTAKSIYDASAKRAKKLEPCIKELKEDVKKHSEDENTVHFMGLIPSLVHDSSVQNKYQSNGFKVNRLLLLLSQIVKSMEEKYELTREKATEAIVFICSTLDRHLSSKSVTAPVCWFTKGNSLDVDTTRNILEYVLSSCFTAGIHIPAISFDGQWHNIAVRDSEKNPLTKLQLQKDVWREIENMSKQSILKELKDINKNQKWEKKDEVIVAYRRSDEALPSLSKSVAEQRKKDANKQQKKVDISAQETTMSEISQDIENFRDASENGSTSNDKESHPFTLDLNKASILLTMLQTDPNCNKKRIWDKRTAEDILSSFQTSRNLRKLRDVDLKVVVRYLKKNGQHQMRESDTKAVKVQHILNVLGLKEDELQTTVVKKIKKLRPETPKTLKELSYLIVSKMRKSDLNIIFAEYMWPFKLKKWQKSAYMSTTSLYGKDVSVRKELKDDSFESVETVLSDDLHNIGPNDQSTELNSESVCDLYATHLPQDSANCEISKDNSFTDLFYIPAYSKERGQYEVSCIDSSHLLTRTRRKCCKGGLDGCQNNAWKTVAKSGKTNLSIAMVECILDPMSVTTALSHFSESVEKEMRHNGDEYEADLCNDVRMWWKAEDDPGISAHARVNMRLALRKRLMSRVDFGKFPPPGMFIRGWPTQLLEALLASIDAKTLLYPLSRQKTYNNRAFSSLVGETFFSEVTLYDRRGQGTISSAEFEDFMGTAVEKLHIRLDDNRNFIYRTSHKTVYNLFGGDGLSQEEEEEDICDSNEEILLLDHAFDRTERARVKGRKKEETVDKSRNALQRGSLGVRWEKARRNESKLLPTVRMGIDGID